MLPLWSVGRLSAPNPESPIKYDLRCARLLLLLRRRRWWWCGDYGDCGGSVDREGKLVAHIDLRLTQGAEGLAEARRLGLLRNDDDKKTDPARADVEAVILTARFLQVLWPWGGDLVVCVRSECHSGESKGWKAPMQVVSWSKACFLLWHYRLSAMTCYDSEA